MANALRPDRKGTVVLRAHYERHDREDIVDINEGHFMHICCANCDPINDPPSCWYTWWCAEQRNKILEHLRDFHPQMYQVLYRCPINRHHNQQFQTMEQWIQHLQEECESINDGNDSSEDDGDANDEDNGNEDDDEESENDEVEENVEDNDNMKPEVKAIIFQNMDILEAQFATDEPEANEFEYYQCDTEDEDDEEEEGADTDVPYDE